MAAAGVTVLDSPRSAAAWLAARCRGALHTDHRQLQVGDAFLAWPGRHHDARRYLADAWAAGAAACLVEREGWEALQPSPPLESPPAAPDRLRPTDDAGPAGRLAAVDGLRRVAGEIADLYFDRPTAALDVVAVTGTNGKTSTTGWIAQALQFTGRRCAVVGTLGVGEPPHLQTSGLTTPDAVALQAAFSQMARAGVSACAIEASSIGLAEHRLAGTRIAVAAFTNLTRDHLDYHGTMAAYGAAKRSLFEWAGLRAAVIHVGDAFGAALAAELAAQARGLDLWTVARDDGATGSQRAPGLLARLTACDVRPSATGLAFDLVEAGASAAVSAPLVGDFNVENLLVVAGCLRSLGMGLADTATALGALGPVPGRMERVAAPPVAPPLALPEVVVDYAHTPDALVKVLAALAPRAVARGGVLWCVFGCGGDRDASKRAPMGAAAAQGAQRLVVTSDNPRSEPAGAVIEQVLAGVPPDSRVTAIEDRRQAIVHAVDHASPEDLIVIAGKGHETTQEIAGRRLPFDDRVEAAAALRARWSRAAAATSPGNAGVGGAGPSRRPSRAEARA